MEIIVVCATIGLLIGVALIGIGVIIGGMDKAKLNGSDSGSIYPDVVCGNDRSMDRHTRSAEEMIQVLQVLRMGACRYEQDVLNELIEMLGKGVDDRK